MNDEECAAWVVDLVAILLAIVVLVGPIAALAIYAKSIVPAN
jgi:hypothetical protein